MQNKNQLKGSTLIVSLQTFLSSLKRDKNNLEQHAEFSPSSTAFLAVPCKWQRKENSENFYAKRNHVLREDGALSY